MSVTIKPDVTPHEMWENRFQIPTLDDLKQPYTPQLLDLFNTAQERIGDYEGVEVELAWQGPSWKWCLTYHHPDDITEAWAYLVPHPDFVIIAMPMTIEFGEALPWRRLKRFIRDGIAAGIRTGEFVWPWWAVNNKTALEDVLDMVKRKHRYVTS